MFDILYPSKAEAYNVQPNIDPVTAKKHRTLTTHEWCMAFNIFIGFTSRNILMTSRGSSLMSAMSRPSWTRDLWIRVQGTGIFMTFGSGRSVSIPIAHGSCWGPTSRLKPTVRLGVRAHPFGTAKWYPHQSRQGTALTFTRRAQGANVTSAPIITEASSVVRSTQGTPGAMEKRRKCKPMSTAIALTLRLIFKVHSDHWVLTI